MKRFFCQCGHEVFFQNYACEACGRDLAYDPSARTMWSGEIRTDSMFYTHLSPAGEDIGFRLCGLRETEVKCNWLIANGDSKDECQCVSCRTTQVIPDQNVDINVKRWRLLERSKRTLIYSLLDMKLFSPIGTTTECLRFEFLEDQRSNPYVDLKHVLTGHNNGLITINAAEADEAFLHSMKEKMAERYRTLLGHFRHEVGHYYWKRLIQECNRLEAFREFFGDEREDYEQALQYYYERGRLNHWQTRFITSYASSHPHEDWAETWAHYLHMVDTLETAVSYGLSVYEPKKNDFKDWFQEWGRVAQIMNALNRSMGMADPYPFFLSPIVQGKLHFIHDTVQNCNLTVLPRPNSKTS
ncbi:MAG: putative zinc-binding metallopeptidase [Thiotrichales bacterium]|nr:putative zinc-binding metallopeptidase [Thiotrichales bacterium]